MEKIYEVIQKNWKLNKWGERKGTPEITQFICADKSAAMVKVDELYAALFDGNANEEEKRENTFAIVNNGYNYHLTDTKQQREYELIAREMPVFTGKAKGNPKKDGRKWYEVTATETYKRTFRVLAVDAVDAKEIVKEAMNDGKAKCTEGKGFSCERGSVMESRQVDADEYVNTFESEGYYE